MIHSQDPSLHTDTIPQFEQYPVAVETVKVGGQRSGGELTLDLNATRPVMDATTFNQQTGYIGALLAELQIGDGTYGIVDTGEKYREQLGLGTTKHIGWAGNKEAHSFSSDLLFVQIEKTHDHVGQVTYKNPRADKPVAVSLGIPVVVGRNKENLKRRGFIFSSGTSTEHAVLSYDADAHTVHIEDTTSLNGTTVIKAPNQASQEKIAPTKPARLFGKAAVRQEHDAGAERNNDRVAGIAERKRKGEDTILSRQSEQLFGVFDGVGGRAHGAEASNLAAYIVTSHVEQALSELRAKSHRELTPNEIEGVLTDSFLDANKAVLDGAGEGATTGVVAKLHDYQGKKYVIWASVGDSRMYTYNRNRNHLRQITEDETDLNNPSVITNALGSWTIRLNQHGSFELSDGDMLMLCSDGITGDRGSDVLSDNEIATSLRSANNPQEAADNLLTVSRKNDDKSVIVL